MTHQELLEKSAESWINQLTDVLDEMSVGTVISTICGFASKAEAVDDGGEEIPGSKGEWFCSCGAIKESIAVAREHGGTHEICIFKNQEVVDWFKDEEGWERLLEKKLKELDFETVVSADCGYAIKTQSLDEEFDVFEQTKENGSWVCSCGEEKSSAWLADEIGPYDLFVFKGIEVLDWYEEDK